MSREVHVRFREGVGVKFLRATRRNIYVKSRRAGQRVKGSIPRWLKDHLKLNINEDKSAVAHPRQRSFLGFSIGRNASVKLSDKTLRRIKARIRKVVSRSRGRSLRQIIEELGAYLRGWRAYFGYATGDQFRLLQAWLMRKL